MSINTAYYGQENSWLTFPPVTGMTDPFLVGSYSTTEINTYGKSTRTWLACKYGEDINTYKQPLDMSFGWCITDGTAPFDHIYGVTGFGTYHDRYELNQNGKSVIGLGAKGKQFLSNIQNVQYYKQRAGGSAVWGNVPLNFQPDYNFSPDIEVNSSTGLKILKCANSGLSPVLKFDFGYYYLVPIVDYYVLKNTATIADWDNVATDPVDYNNLIASNGYKRDDLYSFYERVNNGTYNADKIIINGVAGYMVHVAWHNDKTYSSGDVSFGSQTETTCSLNLIHANDTTVDLTFDDWYDNTNPEQHNVKIDTVFINNRGVATGQTGIYDGKTSSISDGQFNTTQTAILLSGSVLHQGTGFTQPTINCYEYQTVAMGSTDYTVKRFTDSSLPSTRKNSIAIYATLADFGGINGFREYVRKCCAYFGCFFLMGLELTLVKYLLSIQFMSMYLILNLERIRESSFIF